MTFGREKLLAILLVLFIGLLYMNLTGEGPRRVTELKYKPVVKTETTGIVKATSVPVAKEMEKKGAYRGVRRNPFKPLSPPTVQPPAEPVGPPSPPPPPVFDPVTAKGPSPAQIESGKYRFLGFLQKEGEKRIFIAREKEIFIVKKGDTVSAFQIGEIGENFVIIMANDTKEEFKLIIEDMKPTKYPVPAGGGRR